MQNMLQKTALVDKAIWFGIVNLTAADTLDGSVLKAAHQAYGAHLAKSPKLAQVFHRSKC